MICCTAPLRSRGVALAFCLSTAAFAGDLATVGNPESLDFSSLRLQRIGAWYQSRIDTGELPGAVLLIARNDKIAYFEAIGLQDHAKESADENGPIFRLASMSKPVSSVAAMLLVEEGKLDLMRQCPNTCPSSRT